MLFNVKTRQITENDKPNFNRSDLVEAESKEKAKEYINRDYPNWIIDQIRDVTNCKKYNKGVN